MFTLLREMAVTSGATIMPPPSFETSLQSPGLVISVVAVMKATVSRFSGNFNYGLAPCVETL